MSLVELIIGMTLNSMLALVLAGMTLAVGSGWEHTTGLDDATQQARASIDRIKYMVSQAGVYQMSGQPTVEGIAVVERASGSYRFPEVLVVWSGGRNGGMVNAGVLNRLPRVNELVIYAPQHDDPTRLVEIVSPNDTSNIDFTASNFSTTVLSIVGATQSDKTVLCDRIHTSTMPAILGSSTSVGNVRFDSRKSPTDVELSGISAGSSAWFALVWAQGLASSDSGLRQNNVRIELQLEQRPISTNTVNGARPSTASIPFIGSASYRYVYRP